MSAIDCCVTDAETIEELLEPTVEVPAALLLAAGCGGGPGCCDSRVGGLGLRSCC